MAMNTLKELVEAIKTRSKSIAETTSGTIAGSTANDMVYIAKAVEAITGADALLQLFDEANEPSKVFDYSAATNGVWTLTIDDISKPVLKFTQASSPSQASLTVVVPNRGFTQVIKNETTKDIYVQYSGETNNANKAKVQPGKTGWVYGDYVASGTNKVQHVVDVEAITASLTTVTTDQGDMIYRQGAPSGTTFDISVQVQTIAGGNRFVFKYPGYENYASDQSFYIYPGKTYRFDTSHSSNAGHPLKFSTTKNGTHASPAGTELLDIAPTDGTNDITYTGTPGQTGALTQIVVPSNATADVIYPYCSSHSGMGGNAQLDLVTASGEARLGLGAAGTSLMVNHKQGKPEWDFAGKLGGFAYRGHTDLEGRVVDPRHPGYPGTSGNGFTRSDFSIVGEVTDSSSFPLHANKGIFPVSYSQTQESTYRGSAAIVQHYDNGHKVPMFWGTSTNYSIPDPSNGIFKSFTPNAYRDANKGFDMNSAEDQLGDCIQVCRTYSTSYYLTTNGKVWAGGYNNVGAVGNGGTTNEYRMRPVSFPGSAGKIVQLAVPGGNSTNITIMALDENGKVWGWGYNGHNQLSSSTTTNQTIPVEMTGISGKDVKAVAVIDASSPTCYAITGPTDGYKVYAWGYNNQNQCGNGTTAAVPMGSPQQLEAGSGKKIVKMVAAGSANYGGVYLLNEDGALYYNGYNNTGQAGDNNATGNKTTPTLVSTFNTATAGLKVLDMWAGAFVQGNAGATTDNGDFYIWGSAGNGQCGNGSSSGSQNVPLKVNGVNWVSKMIFPFSVTSTSYYYAMTLCIAHKNEEDWYNKVNGYVFATGYPQAAKGIYGLAATVTTTSWTPVGMPYGYQGKVRDIWSIGYGAGSTQESGTCILMMDGTLWTNGYGTGQQRGSHDTNTTYAWHRKGTYS